MITISRESLREALALYKPKCRVLRGANIEYPSSTGSFFIGPSYYTTKPLEHTTDIEIQLCLNQLAYATLYETIRLNLDPEINDLNFMELQKDGMFIIESKKRFRRQIPNDRIIQGSIEIKEKKRADNILLCYAKFQFENKSCFGDLELAVVSLTQITTPRRQTFLP